MYVSSLCSRLLPPAASQHLHGLSHWHCEVNTSHTTRLIDLQTASPLLFKARTFPCAPTLPLAHLPGLTTSISADQIISPLDFGGSLLTGLLISDLISAHFLLKAFRLLSLKANCPFGVMGTFWN